MIFFFKSHIPGISDKNRFVWCIKRAADLIYDWFQNSWRVAAGYVGGGNFSWHDVCLWLTKLFKRCLCMSGTKPSNRWHPPPAPHPPPFQSNFSCWKTMFKNMNSQSGSWSLGWNISVETAAGVFSVGAQWCRRTDVHIWWRHERRMFEAKKVWRAHSTTKKTG